MTQRFRLQAGAASLSAAQAGKVPGHSDIAGTSLPVSLQAAQPSLSTMRLGVFCCRARPSYDDSS
jgi:hypothetical protein